MICGKTIYPDSRAAIEAIKGILSEKQTRGNKLPSKAYFCDECQGYHVQTENKKSKVNDWAAQRFSKEVNSEPEGKKNNDKKFKELIIHEARKFKVK